MTDIKRVFRYLMDSTRVYGLGVPAKNRKFTMLVLEDTEAAISIFRDTLKPHTKKATVLVINTNTREGLDLFKAYLKSN